MDFLFNNGFYSNNHFLISSFWCLSLAWLSSTIFIILVFFHKSLADLITQISVNIIPINNNNWINWPLHDKDTAVVIHDATFIVSVIAKNEVVIINKNKKFINELLSFHPKNESNIFLNLKLIFRHKRIAIEINVINIVLKYAHDINQILCHEPLIGDILTIGKKTKQTKSNNKYTTNNFSWLLYLLNLCNNFINFCDVCSFLTII